MLRQFNEQQPLIDDSWNSDVLESKLEELWGPEVAHSVLNAHHRDYKGTQVLNRVSEVKRFLSIP